MKDEAFIVSDSEVGQRLDVWCVAKFPHLSRAVIQKQIKEGFVQINGKHVKPKHVLQVGMEIRVTMPAQEVSAEPLPVPSVPILHEDPDIVVVHKPAGIAVHGGAGIQGATVADWFQDRYPDAHVGEEGRFGIVHRLDKDTSGVMVLAKTPKGYEQLKEQFKRHRARKEYLALVFGVPNSRDGRIVQPIGRSPRNPARRTIDPEGKPAITEWRIERTFGNDYALIRVFPFTGRTHQIRVHMHFIGHPIVGDTLYTIKKQRPPVGTKRQLLHAESLTIQLMSGKKKTFIAPLADDFAAIVENLS